MTNNQIKLEEKLEEKHYIQILNEAYHIYCEKGNTEKVNYFHKAIKDILKRYFTKTKGFEIKLECNIPSLNASGKKKCDIVVFKNGEIHAIFPVKIPMSNYKQNKNNSWENLTGELMQMKWCNPNLKIIPINIFIDKPPYLRNNRTIAKFETITNKDICIYKELINKNICYDVINYIVEVEHIKEKGEPFDDIQPIKKFITPYRSFRSILKGLL